MELNNNNPANQPTGNLLDREGVMNLFKECCELFDEGKITPENAFELKLLENYEQMIRIIEGLEGRARLETSAKFIEVATKIYSCQVTKACASVVEATMAAGEHEEAWAYVVEITSENE